MINIDNEILTAFKKEDRIIGVRLTFNDEYVIDGDYVKDLEITELSSGSEVLSLGNTCSSQLTLNMFVPESDFCGFGNAKIKVELGVDVNGTLRYTDAGIFYVDSYKTNNDYKSVNIIAYDAMQKVSKLGNYYTCSLLTERVKVIDILKDILTQASISTSYIGEASTTNSLNGDSLVSNVVYSATGEKSEANTYVGTNELIYIPATKTGNVLDVTIDDIQADDFRLVFYTDSLGTNFHSTAYTTNVYEYEEPDESGVGATFYLPSNNVPLYVGICSKVPEYETLPDDIFHWEFIYQDVHYVNSSVMIQNPHTVDIPPRTMLGYMAGILGVNAMINKSGHFILKKYDFVPISIEQNCQYKNGFVKNSEEILYPTYLTTGYESDDDSNIITVGSGNFGFNYTNPYITDDMAENIINIYNHLYFVSGEVDYRYSPAIESGDIVSVENQDGTTSQLLVLKQNIRLYGGLKGIIYCDIDRNATPDYVSAPSTTTVTQRSNDFDFMFNSVINKITGVTGGYVKFVYDELKQMRAIAIPTRDIELKWDNSSGKVVTVNESDRNTPIWVWCDGGLYHTNNGGTTYNLAMNSSGEIAAEMIVGVLGTFVELQAEHGTIGGWTIGKNSMYSDYTDSSNVTYRSYIQNAETAGADSWVFSVQKMNDDGSFSGNFIVKANGKCIINNGIEVNEMFDHWGYSSLKATDSNLVIGLGNYQNGIPTYLEGNNVYLRSQAGNYTYIQQQGNTRLTLGRKSITIDSSTADRDFINSSGGFVLSANSGNNRIHLVGSSCYISSNTEINGNLSAIDITAKNLYATSGIVLNKTDSNYHLNYADGKVLLGGGEHTVHINSGNYAIHFYAGTSIQCHADLKLNFASSSGTIPLVVNTSGVVTVATSSERYKENITEEIPSELKPEKLYDLPVKVYNYKNEFKDIELVAGTQIGITAEDVEQYYPNALIRNSNGQAESWQDRIMIPAMLKLIQEQKKEIDSLNDRLTKLEKLVDKLMEE